MRRTLGFAALAALVAVAVAQTTGTSLLTSFGKTLNDAKTVQSTYTVQTVGSSPDEFSIALKKPNLARVETPTQVVVADGKQVTTFTKADNTYFKRTQSENDIKEIVTSDEFRLFAGFFNAEAYQSARTRTLGKRQVSGTALNVVEATAPHRVDTYFIANDNVARKAQTDLSGPTGTTTTIVNTKSIDLNIDLPASTFMFTPPAGARELSQDEISAGKWYTDLDEAIKIAKVSNKRVFIDFMATWCGPCKMLEKACFSTPEFKALGKKFVFCRIDVDEQPSLAKKYDASSIPLQVILDPSGSFVDKMVGYGGPDMFFQFMRKNTK